MGGKGRYPSRTSPQGIRANFGGVAVKTSPDWARFESFISEIMAQEHVAGAAVGVSLRGQAIYARGFGEGSIETRRPVTEDTVFGIASVSKSFAALAVMQLVDDGLVDALAPVVEYLPEFSLPRLGDVRAVRVHHCLSHTTGVPPLKRRQGEFSEFGRHIEYLSGYDTEMLGRPGEYLSYCNDTFMLSGAILERLTGRRFRDHVRERILEPLGMSRTTYELEQLASWDNVTGLYNLDSARTELQVKQWPELGTYHVGGGIRSTVLDLLRYGDMYCALGHAPGGGRVVSEAGVLRMRAPVIPVTSGSHYCYALQLTPGYHGVTLVEHGGSLPGVASRWGYIPEEGVAAVVLTNVGGAPSDLIWTGLVNTWLGLAPESPRTEPEATYPASDDQLARLTGLYAADEGVRLRVCRSDDGTLRVEGEGLNRPLRVTAPDRAVYQMQRQEKPLRFHLPSDGRAPAWAVSTGLRMVRRAAE